MSEENLVNMNFGGKECQITPTDGQFTPNLTSGYKELTMSDEQKGQISAFCQQLPTAASAGMMSQSYYIVKWPQGAPHGELVHAKDNPRLVYSMVKGEDGKFVGHAQFGKSTAQAAVLAGFTVMSVATSQYFLAQINQKMSVISKSVDKILEFLYGDKKAELLSEISFAKYVYKNFASIMAHNEQRIATIQSLQEAKKTAIKDIEFYLSDLYSIAHEKDVKDIEGLVNKAFQTRQCLDLSTQLYIMGNLLEVFCSQNYDSGYIKYVESDVINYISKCDKQLLGDFHALYVNVDKFKKFGVKVDLMPLLEKVNKAIDEIDSDDKKELKKELRASLYSAEKASEYCVSTNGTVWLKSS